MALAAPLWRFSLDEHYRARCQHAHLVAQSTPAMTGPRQINFVGRQHDEIDVMVNREPNDLFDWLATDNGLADLETRAVESRGERGQVPSGAPFQLAVERLEFVVVGTGNRLNDVKQRDLSTSRLPEGPRHVCGSVGPFAEIDWDEDVTKDSCF